VAFFAGKGRRAESTARIDAGLYFRKGYASEGRVATMRTANRSPEPPQTATIWDSLERPAKPESRSSGPAKATNARSASEGQERPAKPESRSSGPAKATNARSASEGQERPAKQVSRSSGPAKVRNARSASEGQELRPPLLHDSGQGRGETRLSFPASRAQRRGKGIQAHQPRCSRDLDPLPLATLLRSIAQPGMTSGMPLARARGVRSSKWSTGPFRPFGSLLTSP